MLTELCDCAAFRVREEKEKHSRPLPSRRGVTDRHGADGAAMGGARTHTHTHLYIHAYMHTQIYIEVTSKDSVNLTHTHTCAAAQYASHFLHVSVF